MEREPFAGSTTRLLGLAEFTFGLSVIAYDPYLQPARAGDQRSTCANTSKLHRHLGWKAKTKLDEGLTRQVVWQSQLAQLEQQTTQPQRLAA